VSESQPPVTALKAKQSSICCSWCGATNERLRSVIGKMELIALCPACIAVETVNAETDTHLLARVVQYQGNKIVQAIETLTEVLEDIANAKRGRA
jgi:hypothetical protein